MQPRCSAIIGRRPEEKQEMSPSAKIILGGVLGTATGQFFGDRVAFLQPVGNAFIQLLQMAVLPYIIDTDTQAETMARVARISGKPEAEVRKERTAHIAVGRMGRPEEVADVIVYLATPRANWINGRHVPVDGLEQPTPVLENRPW